MPADLQKARELFLHAVGKLPPEQWDGYVAAACGGDAELGRQLGRLLQVHREAGSFLDRPAAALGATDALAPGPGEEAATVPPCAGVGTTIGPYKLLQQIGEGGMGTVFMAEQTHPVRRQVALKVIKPGMDSRQVIARFEAERQALAVMDHVNIARVLDAGATECGRPYFVMELVHGVPITRYCDDNQLTPRERLELFVPVCRAIQHAHQKGIIHRDVKPSNVMVTLYDGKPVPKVIDFGVAKATEQKLTERTLFTQYGTMVGTLEYMSPEQAEMSALGVDTRSDIYSLGVLLYELLTGSTPLSRKRLKAAAYGEVLRMIKEEEPPRPSTRLSDSGEALVTISAQRHTEPAKLAKLVRGELDWIVMKTLEKDRNRRYQSASSFAADVQRYLNDEPVQACPPSAGYRFRKLARRHRVALATASVLAAALVLGTAVSTWQAIRATRAEGLAQTRLRAETEARNGTWEQLRLTEQAQEQATRRLYRSLVDQARASRLSRRPGQRFRTLDVLAEAARMARDLNLPEQDLLQLRNQAIACLVLPDLRVAREWPGWPTGSLLVDFDPSLERYARVDRQGVVSIRRVADDAPIGCLAGFGPGDFGPGSEAWPLFSPDGRSLLLGRGERVRAWKLADPGPVEVIPELSGVAAVAFSPDSRQLAVGRTDGSIDLVELSSGRHLRQRGPGPRALGLAFHPRERQLAIRTAAGVQIRDLETGNVKELPQPGGTTWVAWNPDGKTLAVAGADRIIHIWDVATRQPLATLQGPKNEGMIFAFNRAGDLLASAGWDGFLRLWDPRTGQQLFGTPAEVRSLRFSPDDHLLAAGSDGNKLRLWEVAAALGYRTLVRDPVLGRGEYHACATTPRDRLLAVGMLDGVGLWDLSSGKPLGFLRVGRGVVVKFATADALLTNGEAGLLRWPIRGDPAAGLVRIGPPRKLPLPGGDNWIGASRDGKVVASAQSWGGLVWRQDLPGPPLKLSHWDARCIDVSPDGLWVATGSHWGTKVRIWDARTGKLAHELPVETGSWVRFSPDGRRLATTGGGCRLWAVDSGQEGPHLGDRGQVAFSADGKLLAVETGSGVVRLVNPDTGREYARLEDPNQEQSGHLSFARDGAQLVATNTQSIHVWDLRAIREQLARMGLDWELPAYPPADPDDDKPLRVEVDLGEVPALLEAQACGQQGLGYVQSGQWDKAIGAYTKAIELDPRDAVTQNNLAWLLSTCPDAKFRDPGRAVELTRKAIELAPQDGYAWNTLGAAHYRARDWKAATLALEKSNDLLGGKQLSFNAFFLAMAHWQLGTKDEARKWYAQGVQWMEKHKPRDEELGRFRAEAASLLEVQEKKD